MANVSRLDAREIAKQNNNETLAIMKTSRIIAALTGIALFSLAGSVQAQYRPTGDDGITASPKLRERLDERERSQALTAAPEIAKMPCPKCKDTAVLRPAADGKPSVTARLAATGAPAQLAAKHLCDGCGVKWTITGVGKAKKSVATHECVGCGEKNLACCNTTKGSTVATLGMERKNLKDLNFEVAPVK